MTKTDLYATNDRGTERGFSSVSFAEGFLLGNLGSISSPSGSGGC